MSLAPDRTKPHDPSRTILVGTPDTLRVLGKQLWHLPEAPEPIGCVVVGEASRIGVAHGAAGPVLCKPERLTQFCNERGVGLAVVSIPAPMDEQIRSVRESLRRASVAERFVPPMQELLSHAPSPGSAVMGGGGGGGRMGKVDLPSLVGRPPAHTDTKSLQRTITGKRVLITGAGGSIGSELARVSASLDPERLILMERSENALFEIDRTLAGAFPSVARSAVMHDVVERERTAELVRSFEPHVVFHAAAHKHVPLMEDHPSHAVANNVFGTASIADAARGAGAERFVLVSTDKAVHPRSVMGATKRLAELYVRGMASAERGGDGATLCSIVRFGNVLGSAGSVLPIWSAQLGEGEAITVTDERMTRYFMTIPEAASLVAQAAALADTPGEARVFMLDMGEPINILELAQRFVEAHGMTPLVRRADQALSRPDAMGSATLGPDTFGPDSFGSHAGEILITGVRPGEKLSEALAYEDERLESTPHPRIRALGDDTPITAAQARSMLESLSGVLGQGRDEIVRAIARWIPEMGETQSSAAA